MSTAEYIATFASIVVGLAFTDLLTSLHRLMRARRTVQWDWLPIGAALLVVLGIVQVWWRFYVIWTAQSEYTFGQFLPDLLSLTLLFFLAAAALPDDQSGAGVNLREYYDENRGYFWGLFVAYILVVTLNRVARTTGFNASLSELIRPNLTNLISMLLMVVLIFTRRRWIHGAVILTSLAFLTMNWVRLSIAG